MNLDDFDAVYESSAKPKKLPSGIELYSDTYLSTYAPLVKPEFESKFWDVASTEDILHIATRYVLPSALWGQGSAQRHIPKRRKRRLRGRIRAIRDRACH